MRQLQAQRPPGPSCLAVTVVLTGFMGLLAIGATNFATLAMVNDIKKDIEDMPTPTAVLAAVPKTVEAAMSKEATLIVGTNVCKGKKPIHSDPAGTNGYFNNIKCAIDGVTKALEQAGANVTAGYTGGMINATDRQPITDPYWKAGLCPVNVHWHLGAEHLSMGEFDENGKGPGYYAATGRKMLAAEARQGLRCKHYDAKDKKFTTDYDWKHCKDMKVGETYEVHWPHSAAGACGTPNQYQTPFYDGVFCTDGIISLKPLNTFQKIGVQAQVFTIVNDEDYYYPDLIRGMIVDGTRGQDIAKYTGSTTGTSRSNEDCSQYTPITWQVDRKCNIISASTFDKMCADMKAQRDDMTEDLHPHGSREIVIGNFTANNLQ